MVYSRLTTFQGACTARTAVDCASQLSLVTIHYIQKGSVCSNAGGLPVRNQSCQVDDVLGRASLRGPVPVRQIQAADGMLIIHFPGIVMCAF